MADKPEASGGEEENPLDLSALDFGPSWARDKSEPKEYKEYKERPDRGKRRDDRKGGYRGGGGGGDRRSQGHGGGGGGRGKFSGQKGRGRDQGRERSQREEVRPPEDVVGQILPGEEGLDALAKEVLGGGRTYSVFDLAKVIMGARERFNVGFKASGETKFLRCKRDGAIWLTKSEALNHFSRSSWKTDFYKEIVSDEEPPKGNFQSVAVCGISNEILGPPNYHGYQSALVQLHRERFSNMPIDRYKSKIRMEKSEEAVQAWLDKMSKQTRYLPISLIAEKPKAVEEAPTASEEPAKEAPQTEVSPEAPVEESATVEEVAVTPTAEAGEPKPESSSVEDSAGAEAAAPTEEVSEPEEKAEKVEEEISYDPADLLPDLQAVERHFAENHFGEAFVESNKVWVAGGIPGNQISPGLLTLLRETVSEERRYPGKLTPMLCRQLSGRHVAVFKWKKKLKVGPSRPHEVPTDIQLAERPKKLLEWVKENSGENLEKLWEALLPADVSDKEKHEWYHDLHWLLNQGYVLLLADSTLHLSKKPVEQKAPKAEKKEEKTPVKPVEEKVAEVEKEGPTVEASPAPTSDEQSESESATPAESDNDQSKETENSDSVS